MAEFTQNSDTGKEQARKICSEVTTLAENLSECQWLLERTQARLSVLQELINHTENILQHPGINSFRLSDLKARAEERYKKYQSGAANARFYEAALLSQIHLLERKEVAHA